MENYTFEPDSERNSREGKIGCKIRACTSKTVPLTNLCGKGQSNLFLVKNVMAKYQKVNSLPLLRPVSI